MTVMQLFGLALSCFALAAFAGWHGYRQRQQWLAQSRRYGPPRQGREVARDWLAWCGRGYPVGAREQARLQQLLAQAGIFSRHGFDRLRAAKLLGGLGGAMAVLLWRLLAAPADGFTLMWVLVAYVVGAGVPERWLQWRARKVKAAQQKVVPDAIDLLVISVEAGLALDRALLRVGHYLGALEPGLARQFLRTHAEIQMRGDQAGCLARLAWRTGLPELDRLANTLQMAQQYGSPLAETMRTISQEARQMRRLALEEQAGSLPGKITLIQMALIMLPMLVLIIAPTLNLLINSLR
ncbi:TPA: type II secretion system F family protein [Aeromonas hydrophila]|uniref:Flp fimbrial biogenesis protein FlpH n=1 Tax=Aeromonas hydrophila TaxID=644 RepID=UPI001A35353C|nr:Flp fimbrial biogenesis protein FlpH [Aeromonas hydrophila]WRK90260.1 Flp fimbrial biogenesis protein FlpH [Aeromonas hydrophila]HAT2711710.1 type II secretion system F family protein [Aeromonas hydrophila]